MTVPGNLHSTSSSHGGYVAVCSALLTLWMLLFYFTRVLIRLRYTSWGPDDWAITIGTCLALVQVSCVFVAIRDGFGLTGSLLRHGQLDTIRKVIYVSQIFYIATISTSKCSTALLITRLTRTRGHLLAARVIVGFTILWSVCAIIVISWRDNTKEPWQEWDDPTSDLYTRWIAIETIGMAIEVALVALAATLVNFLSMTSKVRYVVIGAFGIRLLTIIPTICRLIFLNPHRTYLNPTFLNVLPLVLTQVCMHTSLIAATIPCLKSFVQPFEAGYAGDSRKILSRRRVTSFDSRTQVQRNTVPSFMFGKPDPTPDNQPRPSVVSYYSTAEDNQRARRASQACFDARKRRKSKSLDISTREVASPMAQEEWMLALRNPAAAPLSVRRDTLGFEVTVDSGSPRPGVKKGSGETCGHCSATTRSEDRDDDDMVIHQLREVKVEYSHHQP